MYGGEHLGSKNKKDFLNFIYFLLSLRDWVPSKSSWNFHKFPSGEQNVDQDLNCPNRFVPEITVPKCHWASITIRVSDLCIMEPKMSHTDYFSTRHSFLSLQAINK